jgi:hypothetical protein
MAYLKFSCKEGKPCFQHDGGSGYMETGNRLLAFARDERAYKPDSTGVDFLNSHKRMLEIHFIPALFPQNWTVQVESRGMGAQEKAHLNDLAAKINETIAARTEFQVADFFLYYSAAYDFQVVWAESAGSILPLAPAEELLADRGENAVRLVYRGELPLFSLRAVVEEPSHGPVLRFLARPSLRSGKCDSVDIGIYSTYEGSGKLHFAAGIKINNYGGIPVIALNQAFWSVLLNGLNEALPQRRELDLSSAVSFLSDAYDVSVFTPPVETPAPQQPVPQTPTETPASQAVDASPPASAASKREGKSQSITDLSIFKPLLYLLLVVIVLGSLGDLINLILQPQETLIRLLAPISSLFISIGKFLGGGS